MNSPTVAFKFKNDSNAAARLASLEESPGGPLRIASTHILAVAMGDELKALTGGDREITMHMLEDLSLQHLIFDEDMMDCNEAFLIYPKFWTGLAKSIADAGTDLPSH